MTKSILTISAWKYFGVKTLLSSKSTQSTYRVNSNNI